MSFLTNTTRYIYSFSKDFYRRIFRAQSWVTEGERSWLRDPQWLCGRTERFQSTRPFHDNIRDLNLWKCPALISLWRAGGLISHHFCVAGTPLCNSCLISHRLFDYKRLSASTGQTPAFSKCSIKQLLDNSSKWQMSWISFSVSHSLSLDVFSVSS